MNWDLYKFISVEQMMTDIGKGIGNANRQMQKLSQTSINSLAVKDGSITVQFELTSKSESTANGLDIPGLQPLLGAKTFRLTSDTATEQVINKASIVLNIVSVAPAEGPALPTVPGIGGGLKDALEKKLATVKDIDVYMKSLLTSLAKESSLSQSDKKEYSAALGRLLDSYEKTGDIGALRAGFLDFLVAHETFFRHYLNV
ncbi:MAG: hypothetical protein JWP27_851 [Flaviaesturariibacter sp.]|nr:hypothetical protein [Flaviaesturariibacter sp.]